jgi:hypothetical protein
MIDVITSFAKEVATHKVEVYNRGFSLQHELGIFLRSCFSADKVQFERNVSYFGFDKQDFIKREIDISIFSPNRSILRHAIELKFPRNGQYPEQMYSFCTDIVFIEQLKTIGFQSTFLVIFADDPLFYRGGGDVPYCFFRQGRSLHGVVRKPTGKKDSHILLGGQYQITWNPVRGDLRYTIVEANIRG